LAFMAAVDIPRTLLVTWWPADIRYAGGAAIRRIVERLPAERLAWASLRAGSTDWRPPCRHRAFMPRPVHWRLQRTALAAYVEELQARRLARAIAAWARDFDPQLVWVLPELGASAVGRHVASLLGRPVHVTVHDAHETARRRVACGYYPWYAWQVKQALRSARSADAISEELLAHLQRHRPGWRPEQAMVLPPSMPRELVQEVREPVAGGVAACRRIGFCGSMRNSPREWAEFLALLGRLPFAVEILAWAYEELFPRVTPPPNVQVRREPYAVSEAELLRTWRTRGVHAAYLGLWKDPARRLFARTSLSAKLATYAAAAVPVIVDGPGDAAAWRLVARYDAGILCAGRTAGAELERLFTDAALWERLAQGARRLALEAMNLERNVERFADLLRRAAG